MITIGGVIDFTTNDIEAEFRDVTTEEALLIGVILLKENQR